VTRISDLPLARRRGPAESVVIALRNGPWAGLEFAQMISMFSSANARPNSGLGLEIGCTRCSYKSSMSN
jgi:hypothetical protein